MNYKSKYFTVENIEELPDKYIIRLNIDRSYVLTTEIILPIGKRWTSPSKLKRFDDHYIFTFETETWDKSIPSFWLNRIELAMKRKDFRAKDHVDFLKDFPNLSILAKKITEGNLFDGNYQELSNKIEEYCFKDSPYFTIDSRYYEYLDNILFNVGVESIVDHIAEQDVKWIKSFIFMRKTCSPILNEYWSSSLREEDKNYFNSIGQKSLIDLFAVKTNGFNQDFSGISGKDSFSAVTVRQIENHYTVFVTGADDSSYGKDFENLEKAKKCAEDLKLVSTILTRAHLLKMGFRFTN